MRSASARRISRLGLLAVCGLLLAGAVSGCMTTQETAAKKQAESKRFLAKREARRRQHTPTADGPKGQAQLDISSRRQGERGK